MEGMVTSENNKMLGLMGAFGCAIQSEPGNSSIKLVIEPLDVLGNATRLSDSFSR